MKKKTNQSNTKVCNVCGRELPLSAYNVATNYVDGLKPTCRECMRKKAAKTEWAKHNLAYESVPWPFDDDQFEMELPPDAKRCWIEGPDGSKQYL